MALGLDPHRLIAVFQYRRKGEPGQVELAVPRVKPGQGEQVLDNMGHPVALVEDHLQKVTGHLRGQVGVLLQGLGIAANVGDGGSELMGDVGHKLLAHGLVLHLLGDIVDHHQHPHLLLPVKGRQEEQQRALSPDGLALQAVPLQGEDGLQRGDLPKKILVGNRSPQGNLHVQHLLGSGVGVDDLSALVEGHHPVGHVKEQGAELGPLAVHRLEGGLKLAGHGVEGVGEHPDLVVGLHLDLVVKIPLRHPLGPPGQRPDGRDHGPGEEEREEH